MQSSYIPSQKKNGDGDSYCSYKRQPICCSHAIGVVGSYLTGETAGRHGSINIITYLKRAIHQTRHRSADPATLLVATCSPDRPAFTGFDHSICRVEKEKNVAVGH